MPPKVGALPFDRRERPQIIAALVSDAQVLTTARAEVASGQSEEAVRARARSYAREIVPRFSAYLYYRLAYRLAREAATLLYRVRVGYVDQASLARVSPDSSIVFVMNHRSNMDYVLVAFLVREHVALSYAVGEWARIWPLDTLLRRMGAYFIRRNSRDKLYRKLLERYVQIATGRGVPQAIFPEGGLSRDGRLRPPKVGLLYYMLKGFDDGGRDVVFVPVGLNYDRVLEDRSLLLDLPPPDAGRDRQTPFTPPRRPLAAKTWTAGRFVAKHLALLARGRFHRFGYACVNFGTPLSLAGYLSERRLTRRDMTDEQCFSEATRIADLLMDRVARVIPVTPVSLVAAALLSFDRARAPASSWLSKVEDMMGDLNNAGAKVYLPRQDVEYFFEVGRRMLAIRRLIRLVDGAYEAAPGEELMLRYYANSIARFFEGAGAVSRMSRT